MKNILLTIAFFNTMLLSKVMIVSSIEINNIEKNEIKTEEDFIKLIKDADSAQKTINSIENQITGGNKKEKGKYVMPGFSVFIPDNDDKDKPKKIFIAMKDKSTKSKDANKQNEGDCINTDEKTLSFNKCAHTERQLCYAAIKSSGSPYIESAQEENTQEQTIMTDGNPIELNSLKNLKGTLFIFCKENPCFTGDKQTTISCFEYYSELIKITNKINKNLKIKIFFPKKSKEGYDLIINSLNRINFGQNLEDFEEEYLYYDSNDNDNYKLKITSDEHSTSKDDKIDLYHNDPHSNPDVFYFNPGIYESDFFTKNAENEKIQHQKQALESIVTNSHGKIELIAMNYSIDKPTQ